MLFISIKFEEIVIVVDQDVSIIYSIIAIILLLITAIGYLVTVILRESVLELPIVPQFNQII